ncbi:hypothetical protein BC831DRAFT_513816 [Entophlyctis helioformis]|nr:hypothetical protein BC831DRAFT_513816 [Entophlyctis helioformis]
MNISNAVSAQVGAVHFSFYSASDVRKLSVKHITNPLIFDNLDHPTAGGLYDSALGPYDKGEVCTTCHLGHSLCPGHFGHIELSVPVYNPITFRLLYKLLQSTCYYCHRLRTSRTVIHHFGAKLRLVQAGLIVEASQLDQIISVRGGAAKKDKAATKTAKPKASKSASAVVDNEAAEDNGGDDDNDNDNDSDNDQDDNDDAYMDALEAAAAEEANDPALAHLPPNASASERIIARIEAFVDKAFANANANPKCVAAKTTLVTDNLRRLERQFLQAIPSLACQNCGGQSPKFRTEAQTKIFERPLAAKQRSLMNARNLKFEPLFGESSSSADAPAARSAPLDRRVNVSLSADDVYSVAGVDPETAPADGTPRDTYLTPLQVRAHLELLWKREQTILDVLYGTPQKDGTRVSSPDIFFQDVVSVPPNRFRPLSKMGDMMYEHPQNIHLTEIIKSNHAIQDLQLQEREALSQLAGADPKLLQLRRAEYLKRTVESWIKLQQSVNYLIDSSKAPLAAGGKPAPPGVRQILEKKEGLFRKHMMGKRVNYAARSVISPDPYIETNEIGIPPVFATKLTYPEPVTHHNVKELRKNVINGPTKWPGAAYVQNEDGSLVNLAMFDEAGRTAIANQLLTPSMHHGDTNTAYHFSHTNKKVYRHLRNGDFLLLNRQPTLHKPSIMAHTARVLPNEKTIRMHYANCNTYNADFDGDEMNAHLPQNELARAEAMLIARTDQQYLVPTDGGVLRGLIQDHVDAGVDMCSRDTFFTREEYLQLVYAGLLPEGSASLALGNGNIEEKIKIGRHGRIVTLPPAIFKPTARWTGKQIISTILVNLIPEDRDLLNLKSKSRIPAKQWGPTAPEEQQVLFMDGYLLTGILDKSQFGASAKGLVHAMYEFAGFTCRMDDLRLTEEGDQVRRDLINRASGIGREAVAEVTSVKPVDEAAIKKQPLHVQSQAHRMYKPRLLKPFPANNMQVMTVSGAKGSGVNVSQISCLLGQQELEGKRVPTMISGKTLPSFLPFETSARAGGYITGRFLTGIRPQEYYFHCMAGREGLIDTAVKTSRSGYLQRCLIKHLEGLRVHYDHTVRDLDGSVLQFQYGEDALDVIKQTTLTNFEFCALNYRALLKRYDPSALAGKVDDEQVDRHLKRIRKQDRESVAAGQPIRDRDPLLSIFSPSRFIGAVSDKFSSTLDAYIEKNDHGLLVPSSKKDKKDGKGKDKEELRNTWSFPRISPRKFRALMELKYMHSLVEPGEAVGLLAAQSIGEPSTQMTLNTFHFAGFGAKNVTLGIPRLREIIMTASASIQTPLMRLPLNPGFTADQAEDVAHRIHRLVLSQVMEGLTVSERLTAKNGHDQTRRKVLTLRLQFWPKAAYKAQYEMTPEDLGALIETKFVPQLDRAIARDLKSRVRKGADEDSGDGEAIGVSLGAFDDTGARRGKKAADGEDGEGADEDEGAAAAKAGGKAGKKAGRGKRGAADEAPDDDDDDDDAESDEEQGDGDVTATKSSAKRMQQATYDEPDEDDEDVIDAMNRLDGNGDDDEEEAVAAKAEDDRDRDGRTREDRIREESKYVSGYKFDKRNGRWCEITLEFAADTKKILMVALAEDICHNVVIREVKGISRCYPLPNESENDKSVNVGTDGVNLRGMWEFSDVIDVHSMHTNDIAAILQTYGVEAARAAIMQEIAGVFGVYGIQVDPRHLSIIADYMTFEGGYKPFNRMGMNSNPSPFSQMSFETTTGFLTTATLSGDFDPLDSPSARLVMGQVVKGGTGSFAVLQPIAAV